MAERNEHQKSPLITEFPLDAKQSPSEPVSSSIKHSSWLRKQTTGWRFGVIAGFACSTAVFLVNLVVFLWAESKNGWETFGGDGKRALYDGDCEVTKRLNIGVHLLINVLSTLLLSASNYCMQCMSAPTRQEVDRAHTSGGWVDIGIQSLRNLKSISGKRTLLYFFLGLSSVPLHLFYNSAVFSSIAANEYFMFSANELFADPKSTNFTGLVVSEYCRQYPTDSACISIQVGNKLFKGIKAGTVDILDPLECLDIYARPFRTVKGSVILVGPNSSDRFNQGRPFIRYEDKEVLQTDDVNQCPPFDWICGRQCTDGHTATPCQNKLGPLRNDIVSWKPFGIEVKYCIVEPIDQHCRLLYNPSLAVIVIGLNAFKAIIMLYIVFAVSESPLMTMGDAVSSFLRRPDLTTKDMCLLTMKDFKRTNPVGRFEMNTNPRQYQSHVRLRFAAASSMRWFICFALLIIATVLVLGLMIWGVYSIKGVRTLATLFEIGLGGVDTRTFIRWKIPQQGAASIVLNVLIANIAQLVLSFIYFTYNGVFTCMSLATEWSRLALQQKGLRISGSPEGAQRSTYFLQLPYRFAIPLMVTSGVLHWLISQSIFLVNVEAYSTSSVSLRERDESSDYMTCGYSPVAMIIVIIIGVSMILAACWSGRIRLQSAIPVVGSCSAAISAACHSGVSEGLEGENTAISMVKWGALARESNVVGHCCITDREVVEPQVGSCYAGSPVFEITSRVVVVQNDREN